MSYNNNLNLEDQLSFIMYVCSKETIKHYKSYLKDVDLTYTQYITMLVLWNKDNVTVNELGQELYLDSGTLTPILKRLEAKGLVERTRDTVDERNVFIKVTEQGVEVREKVKDVPGKVLNDTGVPIGEAKDILNRLKSVLAKVTGEK